MKNNQNQFNFKVLIPIIISLCLVFLSFGIMIGYGFSSSYQANKYNNTHQDLGIADYWLDLRYLRAMRQHHQSALLMANDIGDLAQRDELKTLAEKIKKDEPSLIYQLDQWRVQWFGDYLILSDPATPNFGASDEYVDLRILNALINHHEEGIEMAEEVLYKSSRTEVLNDANAVRNFLQSSREQLIEWRTNWYELK